MSDITEQVKTGLRYNTGKLRWRNIPMFLLKPLIMVGHKGEEKYEAFNFLKGMKALDSLDCLKRHLEKLENPEESDFDDIDIDGKPGTRCHHAAMVAWNALVLCFMLVTRPDLDDRYMAHNKRARYSEKSE